MVAGVRSDRQVFQCDLQDFKYNESVWIGDIETIKYPECSIAYLDVKKGDLDITLNVLNINKTDPTALTIEMSRLEIFPNEFLDSLPNLQTLKFVDSTIAKFDKSFLGNLKSLREFYLIATSIDLVPDNVFENFSNLTHLYFQYIPQLKLQENAFVGLINLKVLFIHECELKIIKKNTFNGLTNLQRLHLSNNQIKTLNLNLNSNRNLKEIYLTNNQICSVKENMFSNMEKLVMIDLRGSKCFDGIVYPRRNASVLHENCIENNVNC